VRAGFDHFAVWWNSSDFSGVFDCKNVTDRRAQNTRYLYMDDTGRILEYLRKEIEQCCVEVYEIHDLPVGMLGFAITKGSNLTGQISRAVDWLRGQGFVAQAGKMSENVALPRCDKEAQAAFAQQASTLDEFLFSFIFLFSGLGAALGAFAIETLFHAYTSHWSDRWSIITQT